MCCAVLCCAVLSCVVLSCVVCVCVCVCVCVQRCGCACGTAASLLGLERRERHDQSLEEVVNGAEEHVDQVEQLLHKITPHHHLPVDNPGRRALRARGSAGGA